MPSAENYIGLAETLLYQGKLQEAEEQARRAAELLSEFPEERLKQAELYLLLADVASRRRDMEATLSYSRQAVSLQPTQPKIQANLIRLLMGMGRDREALEACRSWTKADPNSAEAYHALGAAEYKLKHFAAARDALTRAVELEPSNLRARLNLAYALGSLRDLAGYRRELGVLAATGGEVPEAELARQLLAKLQRAQPVPPAT
jgi:tetratricopeptide (TPR) repeat protein